MHSRFESSFEIRPDANTSCLGKKMVQTALNIFSESRKCVRLMLDRFLWKRQRSPLNKEVH